MHTNGGDKIFIKILYFSYSHVFVVNLVFVIFLIRVYLRFNQPSVSTTWKWHVQQTRKKHQI